MLAVLMPINTFLRSRPFFQTDTVTSGRTMLPHVIQSPYTFAFFSPDSASFMRIASSIRGTFLACDKFHKHHGGYNTLDKSHSQVYHHSDNHYGSPYTKEDKC
jgi:hypothetical protein